jgi:2'-5' RNA ligase
MARLFVGIALPEPVVQHLSIVQGGIPGARWESADKMHLTLRFIGEVDGGMQRRIGDALRTVRGRPFSSSLAGLGHFPPRGHPRSIWVGVDDPTPLHELHDRIDRALTRLGLDPDRRKFTPHVTLARLKNAPTSKVAAFIAHHALMRPPPFEVESFAMFSSVLGPAGSKYRIEEVFALT